MARSFLVGFLLVASTSCASTPGGQTQGAPDVRYPRRGAGCELAIYYTAVPGVPAWDDLGIAEITCHINDSVAECLRRMRNEACRMGGDIIYNVPRKPLRPASQLMVYRAQVAHTRVGLPKKAEDADMPPPASAEESAGPVVPLPSGNSAVTDPPAGPPGTRDAGTSGGDAR
ncbi:MAG: hypothetical protein H7X95_12675 [Deltaproteobacteria bacterium]|nr:hypothetical protein [Deltaproteobacteria bacterium]